MFWLKEKKDTPQLCFDKLVLVDLFKAPQKGASTTYIFTWKLALSNTKLLTYCVRQASKGSRGEMHCASEMGLRPQPTAERAWSCYIRTKAVSATLRCLVSWTLWLLKAEGRFLYDKIFSVFLLCKSFSFHRSPNPIVLIRCSRCQKANKTNMNYTTETMKVSHCFHKRSIFHQKTLQWVRSDFRIRCILLTTSSSTSTWSS